MSNNTCTIDDCGTKTHAKGYCRPHYRRLVRYGDPLGAQPEKKHSTCIVEGCEKLARSKSSELCKMHYHRQYRGGEVGEAGERKRKRRNPQCSIDGCEKPDKEAGLCSMHAVRVRRHGDAHKVISNAERDAPMGADHHKWMGNDAGYHAVHARLVTRRGRAAELSCVDCASDAHHWSYNHDDPDELHEYGISANPVAYSTRIDSYSPRCVPCHKRFDLDRKDAQAIA